MNHERPSSSEQERPNKRRKQTIMWGEWMGSHKTHLDEEAERIDRQKAALGGDVLTRLKDLNILIVGLQGVGIETAKNLILSNVGSVSIFDNTTCQMSDRGTNFYISDADVGTNTRAQASLTELKSLNPFCKVEIVNNLSKETLLQTNVSGTGIPFRAIVVTTLATPQLEFLNETARTNNMVFVLAANHGVSCSLFSDFGQTHEIYDATGEPTSTLAVSNIEVLEETPDILEINASTKDRAAIIITVAQAEHGLDDGDKIVFDDMRDELAVLNGKTATVHRVAIASPTDAKLDANGVVFKEALKLPTSKVVENFQRQYDFYKAKNADEKFKVRTITVFNRLAIVLEDDSVPMDAFKSYHAGGLLNQVKIPLIKKYRSLADTLENLPVPQMLKGEEWEAGRGIEIHLSIAAVHEFYRKHQRWPGIHSVEDAKLVAKLAQSLSDNRKNAEGTCWAQSVSFGFPTGEARDLDFKTIERFARLFLTELTGFCAFLGGAAAQEALKAIGKFTPIDQWIHHDEPVLVNDECASNIGPLFKSRYDHQIAVLGKDFQARMANQRVFLVGCGALGCEYLKGLALMGVGTGHDGKIWVTDMDRIEISNLSRQFLFRQHDVGSPKSVSGARVVKGWCPQMNIEALERKVGPDSEDFFDDKFWESLNVCWNALDNVLARRYTDSRCLFYSKPLLESGTLGTKCNSEVVLPFRTSTYNDGEESDENENQIAMCTLRSFPYLPLHCIEYAKQSYFSDYFEFGPDQYETFRKDAATYFEQLGSMDDGEQLKSLKMIMFFIELQKKAGGKLDFEACVQVAFNRMMEDFRLSILNLCYSADEMEKSEGKKFWTGTKRRPRPVDWTDPIPELMEYLYCTANLYAAVWGVDNVREREKFEAIVNAMGLKQPDWTPSSKNVSLSDDGDDEMEGAGAGEESEKLTGELYGVDTSTLQPAKPHDFEKDDDANFHIDFLTVATNLRAWNYDIKSSPRHTVKVTAGRIIPALATTTAMVCGLVDIEFCKLVLGLESQGSEKFLNCNINLAAGSGNFTTFAPDPPIAIKSGLKTPQPVSFTSWDRIDVACGPEQMSVAQLVTYLEASFGVTVDRIFEFGNTTDNAVYKAIDKQKMDWDIVIQDDGTATISDGVFTRWPQIRMAANKLSTLPATSGQRKIFLKQVENVKKALDNAKESFHRTFEGPVSEAYCHAYRPEEEGEKQDYFDRVFAARDYVTLGVHCHDSNGEDITLPCVKFSYSKQSPGRL